MTKDTVHEVVRQVPGLAVLAFIVWIFVGFLGDLIPRLDRLAGSIEQNAQATQNLVASRDEILRAVHEHDSHTTYLIRNLGAEP